MNKIKEIIRKTLSNTFWRNDNGNQDLVEIKIYEALLREVRKPKLAPIIFDINIIDFDMNIIKDL